MNLKNIGLIALSTWVLTACAEDDKTTVAPPGNTRLTNLCETVRPPAYTLTDACIVEAANPSRIMMTTDDFSTGGVSIADVSGRTVQKDVALSETDSVPFYHDGMAYVLHRFGFDRIDVLDPSDGFSLVGQHPVLAVGAGSTNPQSVAFAKSGVAFVSNFGTANLHVYDFSLSPGDSLVKRIDLSAFADADGVPEQGLVVSCGDTVFVAARRLDPNFMTTGDEILIPVNAESYEPYDTAVCNLGEFVRGVRQDPADSTGHSVIMLTTGIERVNLATGAVSWLVADTVLSAVGIEGFHAQSFDFHGADTIYLAAYRADYSAVDIWKVPVAGGAPEIAIAGVNAREKTLEVIGDELWFGDTTSGGEGVRVYDLTQDPPALLTGPVSTGLPPTSFLAIP